MGFDVGALAREGVDAIIFADGAGKSRPIRSAVEAANRTAEVSCSSVAGSATKAATMPSFRPSFAGSGVPE